MPEGCGCDSHPKQMRHWDHCRDCGLLNLEDYPVSTRGLCLRCAENRMICFNVSIAFQDGYLFDHWRTGFLKSRYFNTPTPLV